jgi:hypothetical protein
VYCVDKNLATLIQMDALFEKNASKHINASEVNAKCHLKDIFEKYILKKNGRFGSRCSHLCKKQS